MKIYVAGASKEPERVRAAMDACRSRGWTITCDWLAEIERVGAANEGLTHGQRIEASEQDLGGIDDCEVFWLLAPAHGVGAWAELGYALAPEYDTDEAALRALDEMAAFR